MRGEFTGVWPETWPEIWQPLISQEGVPIDVFCELYRELVPVLKNRPSIENLADIVDSPDQSRQAFEALGVDDFSGERSLASFMEGAHSILNDLGGDIISDDYRRLLGLFIDKYSLRYDLHGHCTLSPTLPGMFASLVRELTNFTSQDVHLNALMTDFETAVHDLHVRFIR
jgi:hypothetical protein